MSAGGIERYHAPRTLEQAAELLRDGPATIIAGGTDVMPQVHSGKMRWQPLLLNICGIDELRGLREQDGAISIGALTTISALLASELVRERLRLLWQACDAFASNQIRNTATVGGNLCNASPAGDTLVPLLTLDAQVVLVSKPDGALSSRQLALGDFLSGPGRTQRRPDELLSTVLVQPPPTGFRGEFLKFGARPALDISTVSIAAGAHVDDGHWRHVRIAFGAVAPTPVRARRAEAALEGRALDASAIEAAIAAADAEIHPISDVRASEWYRRELVHNLLRRVLTRVSER